MDTLRLPYAPIQSRTPLKVGERMEFGSTTADALRFREVRVSEAFTIQDPTGAFFRVSLKELAEKRGEGLVYEVMAQSPESPLQLTLVCAVLARQRMLLVIQKATELGVVRVVPVLTEHSVKREGLEHEKAHAWPNVALRAARQCRRASVPEVREAVPLEEALNTHPWPRVQARFYMDDRATTGAPLRRGPASACLAIGPEGGWSDTERELLRKSGAAPLVLGGRVLRAETAVLTGVALVQHALGDLCPATASTPK